MKILNYSAEPKFASVANKAAKVWNEVFAGHVKLIEAEYGDIVIRSGDIDLKSFPNRIAQCNDHGGRWTITMGNHVKWALSAFQRFFGTGEDGLAAMVHEMGHVFDLPHSTNPSHVMHPEIGGNGSLSKQEKEYYRKYVLTHPTFY